MADQENTLPPSKKRAAGREISRDNPGLDDEEDTSEQETGTFKRASDEVIATRRIVKVRKHQSAAPSAPNPFASIRLVPPSNDSSAAAAASQTPEKVESGETAPEQVDEKSDLVKENPESKVDEKNLDAANEESNPESAEEKEDKTEEESKEKKDNDKDSKPESVAEEKEDKTEDESKEKKDNGSKESSTEGASFGSFHQLSSSQNAFTGVAGSGFSSSTFSFGSGVAGLGSGGTLSGSSFGNTTTGFSFPSNGGSSSIFAATPGGVSAGAPPALKEVPVETGEENEKAVFTADSVLFEYIEGGWKERGKGELKVNVSTTETLKARLVMRARGNYRLILNASLFPDMKLANMDKRGITFACMNSTGEGKEGLSTFALKFKDGSVAEEFRAAVTEHKGEPNTAPKASDDQK